MVSKGSPKTKLWPESGSREAYVAPETTGNQTYLDRRPDLYLSDTDRQQSKVCPVGDDSAGIGGQQ